MKEAPRKEVERLQDYDNYAKVWNDWKFNNEFARDIAVWIELGFLYVYIQSDDTKQYWRQKR